MAKIDGIDVPIGKTIANLGFTTIGSDPEGFIVDDKTGWVIPPTKQILQGEAGLSIDGAQLELHPSQASCRGALVDKIRSLLYMTQKLITPLQAKFVLTPSIRVSMPNRKVFPKEANIFGCESDWCAYKLLEVLNPVDALKHMWRYGGFHVHMGVFAGGEDYYGRRIYKDIHGIASHFPGIIRLTDIIAGIFAVGLGVDSEVSKKRRRMFGKAGCFRLQPHGYEYRTLDNVILRHPKLVFALIGLVRDAFEIYVSRPILRDNLLPHAKEARDIINENDVEAARRVWAEIAPQIEASYGKKFASNQSLGGHTELYWATTLLQAAVDKVVPECSTPFLSKTWCIDDLDEKLYQNPLFSHGLFSRCGLEELVDPVFKEYINKRYTEALNAIKVI